MLPQFASDLRGAASPLTGTYLSLRDPTASGASGGPQPQGGDRPDLPQFGDGLVEKNAGVHPLAGDFPCRRLGAILAEFERREGQLAWPTRN